MHSYFPLYIKAFQFYFKVIFLVKKLNKSFRFYGNENDIKNIFISHVFILSLKVLKKISNLKLVFEIHIDIFFHKQNYLTFISNFLCSFLNISKKIEARYELGLSVRLSTVL